MMKPEIKIDFCDFWQYFDKQNNYFTELLSKKYKVIISDKPDILIHSVYSKNYYKYQCVRISYTAENVRPNLKESDFALSFDYLDDPRHYRLPLYLLYGDINKLKTRRNPDIIQQEKTKFCCIVISNASAKERIDFFHQLSKYKPVDSAGKAMNNIGYVLPLERPHKLDFIKQYKFVISFENTSYPGYTTEKIFEPMLMDCIPIYWGNPLIGKEFNTESFIHVESPDNFEKAIKQIKEIDNNRDLYADYLNKYYLANNKIEPYLQEESILSFFSGIIDNLDNLTPVAKKRQLISYYKYKLHSNITKMKNRMKKIIKNGIKQLTN